MSYRLVYLILDGDVSTGEDHWRDLTGKDRWRQYPKISARCKDCMRGGEAVVQDQSLMSCDCDCFGTLSHTKEKLIS